MLVEGHYPRGKIEVYPAAVGGLEVTFPHQAFNGPGPGGRPWREGRLCLDDPIAALDRLHRRQEPTDAARRLAWWIDRARDWLLTAGRGELLKQDDPFELPDFDEKSSRVHLIHAEDAAMWVTWEAARARAGIVEMRAITVGEQRLHVVEAFLTGDGGSLLRYRWGTAMNLDRATRLRGGWLRLPSPPILEPWQAPQTWGELRSRAEEMGVNLDMLVEVALRPLAGASAPILLVGFPIPAKIGGQEAEVHWQPARMPTLPTRAQTRRYGASRGWDPRRRGSVSESLGLVTDAPIRWGKSENWSSERIGARGRLGAPLRARSVALLGVGAVGSVLAELLVRGGVSSLTLVDGDVLAVGNLVRHTLGIEAIADTKAAAVARRLVAASPHVEIKVIDSFVAGDPVRVREILGDADMVVDCTAQDDVLDVLGDQADGRERRWVSASLGYGGRRLYLFTADGPSFPSATFREMIAPWIESERDVVGECEHAREGPGCWSPLFPARFDAVMMMVALAVAEIDASSSLEAETPEFVVIDALVDGSGRLLRVEPVHRAGSRAKESLPAADV